MKVDEKTFNQHINAFKEAGFNVLESGGDYHSGFEIDFFIAGPKGRIMVACCEPKSFTADYFIYNKALLTQVA